MMQIDRLIETCQKNYPSYNDSCCLVITSEDLNLNHFEASIPLPPDRPVFSATEIISRLAGGEKIAGGAIHISGQTSRAAVITGNGPQLIQWQDGHQQVEIWSPPPPDTENLFPLPLAEEWGRHLRFIGKKLLERLDPTGVAKIVLIALPPVLADTTLPDMESFLSSFTWLAGLKVICRDAGLCVIEESLAKGDITGNGVRHYVLFADPHPVIMVYDCNEHDGSYHINPMGGFILLPGEQPMKVKAVPEYTTSTSIHVKKIFEPEKKSTWRQAQPRWPIPEKFEELLKELPATFNSELWSLKALKRKGFKTPYLRQAYKLLSATDDACTTDDLVRGETIFTMQPPVSLADAVTMFQAVSQEACFKRSLPVSHSDETLGGIKMPFNPTISDLVQLPTNYIYRIWKPVRPSGFNGNYLTAGVYSLNRLLLIIAEHIDESTTLVMAEELLVFRGIKAEPSAWFTASLFLYLANKCPGLRLV